MMTIVMIAVIVAVIIGLGTGHRVGHRDGHLQHYRAAPREDRSRRRYERSRLVRNTHRGVPRASLPPHVIAEHMRRAIRAEVHEASGFKADGKDVRSRNVLRAHKIPEEDWRD